MTDQTTPRQSFRDAFKAILDAEFDTPDTDPEIIEYSGKTSEAHAIIFQIVSGFNRRPSIGRQVTGTQKGMERTFRLQLSIQNPDGQKAAEQDADRVDTAITDNLATLKGTYGVSNVHNVVDMDQPSNVTGDRWGRVIMDYIGTITSTKTE